MDGSSGRYDDSTSTCWSHKDKVAKNAKDHNKVGGGRKAVKLSTDAQSIAARKRRHRISQRFKILQSLVPGGSKMDTVSMLEEAIHYVKFLKTQIWLHQSMINFADADPNFFLSPLLNPGEEAYGPLPQLGFPHSAPSTYQEVMAMPFDGNMLY